MQCGGPKSFPILNHNAGYMNFGPFGICWLIWSQSGHRVLLKLVLGGGGHGQYWDIPLSHVNILNLFWIL